MYKSATFQAFQSNYELTTHPKNHLLYYWCLNNNKILYLNLKTIQHIIDVGVLDLIPRSGTGQIRMPQTVGYNCLQVN